MTSEAEPVSYEKTVLSDLLSAWIDFREMVACDSGFPEREKVLLKIDEALSWKTVRNLRVMLPLVLSIRNTCIQGDAPENFLTWLDEIKGLLIETLEQYSR